MKNIFKLLCIIIVLGCLFSCVSSSNITKGEKFSAFYEEAPLTFIIMPPINRTTNVDAKEYFYTTLNYPICESGYYVLPPIMTMDILRQESAYDAELFLDSDLSLFNKMLGADICVFTIIKEWKKDALLTSTVTVEIEYLFRSNKTNETLFHRQGEVKYVYTTNGYVGLAALFDMIATVAKAATADYTELARDVNSYALCDLPYGKYSESNYELDKEDKTIVDSFSVKIKK